MQKSTAAVIGIIIFILVLFIITTIHNYEVAFESFQTKKTKVKSGIFGRIIDLIADDVPEEWSKELDQRKRDKILKMEQMAKLNQTNITQDLDEDEELDNVMTREELGRHGWNLLHMIASTYPDKVDDDFVVKTNVFLNLFGQFYPCKECSSHFLQGLKRHQFTGKGRQDFQQYLCEMHNRVNQGLKKEQFNCSTVTERWGGCGCKDKEL